MYIFTKFDFAVKHQARRVHFKATSQHNKSNHHTGKRSLHEWAKWHWWVWISVFEKTDQMERETAVYFMIAIYRKHADILVCSSHKTHHMAWEDMKYSAQVEWTALMVLLYAFYGLFCFWSLTVPRCFMARAACKIWNILSTSKSRENYSFFFGLTLYTRLHFSDNDVDGQYLHLSGLWRKRPKPYSDCNCFSLGTTVKINLHGTLVIKLLDSGELSSVILRTQERAVLLMWSVKWLSAVNKMPYAWNNKNQFIFNKILLFDY